MPFKDLNHRIRLRYAQWRRSLVYALLFTILYFAIGILISQSYLDKEQFEVIKVLQKDNTLSYLSVLLAIQIPLFILFLEKMANSGYIYRKLLPRVVRFRELVIILLFGTTAILIAPRVAFLYFPVAILFLVNLSAIYRALTTVFQPDIYDDAIKRHLKNTVNKSYGLMLEHRIQNNKFYERLKQLERIQRSFLGIQKRDGLKTIEIRAERDGYIKNIDLDALSRLIDKEFNLIGDTKSTDKEQKSNSGVEVDLGVSPSVRVKQGATLMTLAVPVEYSETTKLKKKSLRCFDIVASGEMDVKWLDDLLDEFDQQLNKAITEKDTILINQTFEQLQIVLDSVDEFIKSKQEDDYKLNQAFEEINRFAGDELSARLDRLFEMLSDLSAKAIKNDQPDINREIIRFIYRNCLGATHTQNITSIARYDRLIIYLTGLFIYSNAWNTTLTSTQTEYRTMVFDRLKEHTDLLVYELKELEEDSDDETNAIALITLEQWFARRLNDLRTLLLASFRNDFDNQFSRILEILQRVERDRHYDKLPDETYKLIKCNILMIAAYISHKGKLDTDNGKKILEIVNKWTDRELTEILLECANKNFADKWRIDTFDLVADGEMHSVPSYDIVLKSLWVELMLDKPIQTDALYYGEEKVFEQTMFFTDGRSEDKDITILNIINEKKHANSTKLKELVEKFISIRRNWEKTKLAQADLDEPKIKDFGEHVNKAFIEASLANKLFDDKNLIIDKTKRSKGFMQSGINQVFDKEAFITDWHIGYGNDHMAEQLGRQIAENQDRHIISSIASKPKKHSDLKKLVSDISKQKKVWLVLGVGTSIWDIGYKHKDLVKEAQPGTNDLYFKSIDQSQPVQTMYFDGIPEGIYFIDTSKLGKLTVKKQNHKPPVKVDITAYSHSEYLMNGIIDTSPEWLQKKGDVDAQKAFLSSKVRLLVERVFEYKPPKSPNVHYFEIEDAY